MKNEYARKLEFAANVAIIVVAIILAFVLVKKFVIDDYSTAGKTPQPNISVGTKINLPDTDWNANGQTIILVLSTDCRFCHESLPFYQKLVRRAAERGKVKIIAVLPQNESAANEYLTKNNVPVSRIIQDQPLNIGVKGTPTLLLIDREGLVTKTWFGKLIADQENEVFEHL